jgi:hypothetical protein
VVSIVSASGLRRTLSVSNLSCAGALGGQPLPTVLLAALSDGRPRQLASESYRVTGDPVREDDEGGDGSAD